MTRTLLYSAVTVWLLASGGSGIRAATVGVSGSDDLVVAAGGQTGAVIVVSPDAGEWEKRAARDLVHYIDHMSGAKPQLAETADAAAAALTGKQPVLVVGTAAFQVDPGLPAILARKAKPEPVIRSDAIVVRRAGTRVLLAGNNDDAHYYAVAWLLQQWGCRWYMPTEFGECIPRHAELKVGTLDHAYAPPFEVRRYWLSWIGDGTGKAEFMRRNFFNDVSVPNGHNLATFTKDLIPPGKTMFNVPIAEDRTAQHVARQVAELFAAGKDVQLGMEDGLYESDSPLDKELIALQYDKYFLTQSYTDAFLTFYNKVADILLAQHPQSKSRIGFLAYANITIPPVRVSSARKPLVAYLAPIDIDPIHGFEDPRSGPRRELKQMVEQWAKVMQGRVVIYDYDQGMLVWRDVPNPSLQAVQQDIRHYRKVGILGVDTESRGALATVFLNLHVRGQLLWNPEADLDALVDEFYPKFYGPAADPMRAYWSAIFQAWRDTIVTEHEYFVIPAIYTAALVEKLRKHLAEAEAATAPVAAKANRSPDEELLLKRIEFTRLGFQVLDAYTSMVRAAASDVNYRAAVAAGERGLEAREKLTVASGLFTTYKQIGENGYAWWPGEVQQYRELLPFTDGTQGTLVANLPLVWAFRRDPDDAGVKKQWMTEVPDFSWWDAQQNPESWQSRQQNLGHWERVRTDVYLQGQGLITPDFQSFTGHGWYRTDTELQAGQVQGSVHLKFPGLFNECWLYVNGQEVAHRPFKGVWWLNDYRFEWDVDLSGRLKAGSNSLVLRINNPHHFGGMFRRPFLYRAK